MMQKFATVLVVDDVPLMSEFLYGVTNRTIGCKAHKASEFKTAVELLENEVIDMLITDIDLKGASGLELLARVRSGHFGLVSHDIPIIVFSGNTYRDIISKCLQFDVNDFLAKPIAASQLMAKIQHHLSHHKPIKAASHYSVLMSRLTEHKVDADASGRRISASIVRELSVKETPEEEELDSDSRKSEKQDFLYWPEDATTGYHQLDRRLKNIAYNLSRFHNVFVSEALPIALDTERRRAAAAIGYLLYVSKSVKQTGGRTDFWMLFQQRLDRLQVLMSELEALNVKHNTKVLELLKKFTNWWMQTCNRPIVQRVNGDAT